MQKLLCLLISVLAAFASDAQLPETRIYVVPITKTRTAYSFGKPVLVSADTGYNNQPFFAPDGTHLLYSSNAGKGLTDIYKYVFAKRKRVRITNTKLESEYSPRYTPDGDRISCIRAESDTVTQRLVSYDLKGKSLIDLLPGTKLIGYYTWLGGNDVMAFMLPEPFRLTHFRLSTNKQEALADSIGRCIVNFRNKIFYVDKSDTTSFKIKVVARENMRMIKNKIMVDNPLIVEAVTGSEDFCITNDGTFLMGAKGKLYMYNLRKQKGQTASSWVEIPEFETLGLGNFNRIVISPDGTMLAIVVLK